MTEHVLSVALDDAYRLITHGPTVLVSARHSGVDDVMAAARACALIFRHPKLTVVLDKITRTRELIEASGEFVIQIPTVAQARLVHEVGPGACIRSGQAPELRRGAPALRRLRPTLRGRSFGTAGVPAHPGSAQSGDL